MPFYDYFSEETGEEKEIFHSMSDKPSVLDSKGNKMKIKISGGSGYIMKNGTRNKDWKNRYGGKEKKSSSTMTVEESGKVKAGMDFTERREMEDSKKDPYHKFRDTDFS